MKTYELLVFLRPNLDQEEVDKFCEKFDKTVTSLKGKTLETEKMGRKKLSYDIKGFFEGYMLTKVFELPAEQVVELKRLIKLNDNIIRNMFVEVSKVKATK